MINTNCKNLILEFNETLLEFNKTNLDIDIFLSETRFDFKKNCVAKISIDKDVKIYNSEIKYNNEIEEKRYTKRFLKLALYKFLSNHYNKNLVWGALTGIRPTKLAYQNIEKDGEFENFFQNEMLVSKIKTKLVADIIFQQKPYYVIDDNNYDLFVGIPFCPSRCNYCSFLSMEVGREKHINEYIDTLVKEIVEAKKLIKNLRSVYIGGGTPVSLSTDKFLEVMKAIGKQNVEYTVEAGRPDVIDSEKLEIMKEFGVTRICINPQTFSDETLIRIGRKHTAKDVIDKFELANKFGFIINMDLIAGLCGETFSDFKNSIDTAISLSPDNITVHTLCLKKGSVLKENVTRLDDGGVLEMINYSNKTLQNNGYSPYYLYRQKYMVDNLDNTGYTKPGKACIYNIDIMEEITQIVACGANAVSKRVISSENRLERYGEPKDLKTYINKIDTIIEDKNKLFR